MEPYQERVIEEHHQLLDRLAKLSLFVYGDIFDTLSKSEQFRLRMQLNVMFVYRDILEERIKDFKHD